MNFRDSFSLPTIVILRLFPNACPDRSYGHVCLTTQQPRRYMNGFFENRDLPEHPLCCQWYSRALP